MYVVEIELCGSAINGDKIRYFLCTWHWYMRTSYWVGDKLCWFDSNGLQWSKGIHMVQYETDRWTACMMHMILPCVLMWPLVEFQPMFTSSDKGWVSLNFPSWIFLLKKFFGSIGQLWARYPIADVRSYCAETLKKINDMEEIGLVTFTLANRIVALPPEI